MHIADYTQLLDDEIRQFIADTESHYPPDTAERPIADQRAIYNRMCRAFYAGRPQGVSVSDSVVAGGPALRRYCRGASKPDLEPKALVLYFHGGGFVVGGLDSHDDVCAELCARTGYEVVAVDYRLSPEHTHPRAFEDARAAFEAVSSASSLPIILAGDSAGATLAASLAHVTRDARTIGQLLIYPYLGGAKDSASMQLHAKAPMLTRDDMDFYRDVRFGGPPPEPMDVTVAPLFDGRFDGLPPTVIFSAECDPLCDDGAQYADAITRAGGRATWHREAGLVHGYLRARHRSQRAGASFDRMIETLNAFGDTA